MCLSQAGYTWKQDLKKTEKTPPQNKGFSSALAIKEGNKEGSMEVGESEAGTQGRVGPGTVKFLCSVEGCHALEGGV